MAKRKDWDEIVNLTFDFAATKTDGFTVHDLAAHLDTSVDTAREALRKLRITLGTDTTNVICTPAGHREPWTYRLVGHYSEAKPYLTNRTSDMRARLATALSVASPVAANSDRRTRDGKQAALVTKVLSRLIEDLDELELEDA